MAGHVCLEQTHPVIIKDPLSLLKVLFQNLLCYLAYTKVKKISTTARWLGNCIILLLSSVLPINLVAKAGHQMQDAADWASCGNGSLDLLRSLQFLRRACLLWLGSLNPVGSYCCKRRVKQRWDQRNGHFIHLLERRNITSAVRLLQNELDKEEKSYSIKSCPFPPLDNVTLRLCFTVYRFV